MHDWIRSVSVLAMAFVGVTAVTLGLAELIVPAQAGAPPAADGGAEPSRSAVALLPEPSIGGIPGLGGTLTVTGDREGSFRLTDQQVDERYSLVGDDGRIAFEGQPVEVVQMSYDGLEFFPDPDECSVTPGPLDGLVGLGNAELRCDDLTDVRGNGVISLSGSIGLPMDLLAERTLPPSGGTLAVGDETWSFPEAQLLGWDVSNRLRGSDYNLVLLDEARGASLSFAYDVDTRVIRLAAVSVGEETVDVDDQACTIGREELGRTNPRTTVVELTIDCPSVEVPGLGPVPIHGGVVADEFAWPES